MTFFFKKKKVIKLSVSKKAWIILQRWESLFWSEWTIVFHPSVQLFNCYMSPNRQFTPKFQPRSLSKSPLYLFMASRVYWIRAFMCYQTQLFSYGFWLHSGVVWSCEDRKPELKGITGVNAASADQTVFTNDIWFSIDRRPVGWHVKGASPLQATTPDKFVFTVNLSIQQLSNLMFATQFYKCALNSVWTYNWLQGICYSQREEWSLLTTAVSHTRGALMWLGSWSGINVARILTRRRWDYPTALESLPSSLEIRAISCGQSKRSSDCGRPGHKHCVW